MDCAGRARAAPALWCGRGAWLFRPVSCVRKRCRVRLATAVHDASLPLPATSHPTRAHPDTAPDGARVSPPAAQMALGNHHKKPPTPPPTRAAAAEDSRAGAVPGCAPIASSAKTRVANRPGGRKIRANEPESKSILPQVDQGFISDGRSFGGCGRADRNECESHRG